MFKWIKFLGIVQPLKRRKLWRVFEQGEPVSQKRTCRIREALKKKLRDYFGIFPKRRTPPTLLGISTIFLPYFSGQVGIFWVILRCFKVFLGLW